MYGYWAEFVPDAIATASAWLGDLSPVLLVVAGMALGGSVIRFIVGLGRG